MHLQAPKGLSGKHGRSSSVIPTDADVKASYAETCVFKRQEEFDALKQIATDSSLVISRNGGDFARVSSSITVDVLGDDSKVGKKAFTAIKEISSSKHASETESQIMMEDIAIAAGEEMKNVKDPMNKVMMPEPKVFDLAEVQVSKSLVKDIEQGIDGQQAVEL